MWFVYILYSVRTGRTYTGITTDPPRRLAQHNAGKGAKATKAGRPWEIVYCERSENKSRALKREIEIKKLRRASKLMLCGLAA
jgi:putative endonuclease